MTSKQKNLESFLFSIGGVAAMFILLVGIYMVSRVASFRVDLTQEKLYTLSDGTKAILKKLDTPVQVSLFVTQGKELPVEFKTYTQRVEDLLREYQKLAGSNIELKKFDPQPDSDAEDLAEANGVQGQPINMYGEKVYMAVVITMLDSKQVIQLDPGKERLLEYDLSRAISNVTAAKKPVVGVMSALPVMGTPFNPMMARMGQQPGQQEPWILVTELKRDFDLREVPVTATEIESDISILLVIHPKGITDKTTFALDQFILRGGKMIAFLDPLSIVDARSGPQNNPLQAAASGGSNLDKLTKAWGLEFDSNKVLADRVFPTMINRGNRGEQSLAVLSLTREGVNTNDVTTSQLDNMLMPFTGVFSGTPVDGLQQTVLLKSSAQSQLVERFMAEFSGQQLANDFNPSGKEQSLAIRLTGKFKTAFPDGPPKDDAATPPPASSPLKDGAAETTVVLVGDTDMLFDQFAAQVQNLFGQRLFMPMNGNLALVQNLVEQLAGDQNLIRIRSRATLNRPFTLVNKMQAEAELNFQSKIKELEASLADANSKLGELQQGKDANQRFILSPEQQQEIESFRKKQLQVKQDLKTVRKELKKEIDRLQNRVTWLNIAGMPVVVTALGLCLALLKRKRTAAK